jgi:hypothetical protein
MVFDVEPGATAGGTTRYRNTSALGGLVALFGGVVLVSLYFLPGGHYVSAAERSLVLVVGVVGTVAGAGLILFTDLIRPSKHELVTAIEIDRSGVEVRSDARTRGFSWSAPAFGVHVIFPRTRTPGSNCTVLLRSCPPTYLTIDRAEQLVAWSRSLGLEVVELGGRTTLIHLGKPKATG